MKSTDRKLDFGQIIELLGARGMGFIVWENTSTGARSIWLMNGTAILDFADLGTVGTAWHIAKVADFDGDGQTDLLWENRTTGDRAIRLPALR